VHPKHRTVTIEGDGRLVVVDPLRVDLIREGLTALGWFILNRSPLAFLRPRERTLFCSVPLTRHLPDALLLTEVLGQLP
jgi:hypothetical protein